MCTENAVGAVEAVDPLAHLSRQRIDFQTMPDGSERAILTLTLANGRVMRFAADADGDDIPACDPEAFAPSRLEVGARKARTSADKLSAAESRRRVTFSWESWELYPRNKRRPKGWKKNASWKTMHRWWESIGKKQRTLFRIRYAAIKDFAPKKLSDKQRHQFWESIGKKGRSALRRKYRSGIGFDDLADLAKGVAKVAKGIATSKVFRYAAKGLALVAPVLGPLAPAALGVSAAMGVASTAAAAYASEAAGAIKTAKKLAGQAKREAKKLAPRTHRKLLKVSTTKAKRALNLAVKPKKKRTRTAKPLRKWPALKLHRSPAQLPAAVPSSSVLLAAARAGRVRSNRAGKVSPTELLRASHKGRVYFLSA